MNQRRAHRSVDLPGQIINDGQLRERGAQHRGGSESVLRAALRGQHIGQGLHGSGVDVRPVALGPGESFQRVRSDAEQSAREQAPGEHGPPPGQRVLGAGR
jgi:hypothetical protein